MFRLKLGVKDFQIRLPDAAPHAAPGRRVQVAFDQVSCCRPGLPDEEGSQDYVECFSFGGRVNVGCKAITVDAFNRAKSQGLFAVSDSCGGLCGGGDA
jgi:hypothetical protein